MRQREEALIRFVSVALMFASTAMCQTSSSSDINAIAKNTAGNTAPPTPISPANPNLDNPTFANRLPDLPPLPLGKASLLGGTIRQIDHLRNQLVLNMFGGGHISVLFDERTKVLAGSGTTSLDSLKTGQRVYLDTTLDGTKLFARSVRLGMQLPTGQSSGQVVDFDQAKQQLTLRDSLSPKPFRMQLSSATTILDAKGNPEHVTLEPGTLVSLTFTPDPHGDAPRVQQVRVVARPGASFLIAGQVETLDLHRDLLVVKDPRDGKTFELRLSPSVSQTARSLRLGQTTTVHAVFDGKVYVADRIEAATQANPSEE